MTHTASLMTRACPTVLVDGLEIELFATDAEALAAFAAIPSSVEQQAAAFVAATASLANMGE